MNVVFRQLQDCNHVSRTLEEFYTVRCQVADMRNLYQSLNEVTVKDTLEGDNCYTCSQCSAKVRAEKRSVLFLFFFSCSLNAEARDTTPIGP